jgi:signal transduction histidine kinase
MNSIRRKLTRSLLLLLGVTLGGGLAFVYYVVREELVEGFDRTLQAKAQAISLLALLDGDQVNLDFSNKLVRGFASEEPRDFFEIWRADGTPVRRSASLRGDHLPNRVGPHEQPAIWALELPRGQRGRAFGVEFTPRLAGAGAGRSTTERFHLVVAARTRGLEDDLDEILVRTGIGGILLVAVIAVMVSWILRRELRPLERLAGQAEKINAETLALRFPTDGVPRELQAITDRLNALLIRLEQSFERERRVSAAMAHELRTPIAELRNQAECALKWPESRDPESDRDALAIARQMEAIVTHMLTLARSETGHLQPDLAPVDLARAVAQAWKPLGEPAARKNSRLRTALPAVVVRADPVLVRSILGNLLENAVEYSPDCSDIDVRLEASPAGFALAIANPAPDLTPDDVAHFFERFWRKEQARSGGRHAGLGLSLARAFARTLGWEITPRLGTDGRLVVTLSGPRA